MSHHQPQDRAWKFWAGVVTVLGFALLVAFLAFIIIVLWP